jgi:hypothetical protein
VIALKQIFFDMVSDLLDGVPLPVLVAEEGVHVGGRFDGLLREGDSPNEQENNRDEYF